MDVGVGVERDVDRAVADLAAAIGEPARTRILYCLMDKRARTSTELAVVAGISPSTASVHLNRLKCERLIQVHVQGKHRYYSLERPEVADLLEGMSALAGLRRAKFVPHTPNRLRAARTCYDHIAGTLGVQIHDAFVARGWIAGAHTGYALTPRGVALLASLGADVDAVRASRRRFAFGCLDWSERRSHIGGALGAAILTIALERKWVRPDLDSRSLSITRAGVRELSVHFGVK